MYTFRDVTPRIRHMRERIRDRVVQCDSERAALYTKADQKFTNMHPLIKRPLIMKEIAKNRTIRVEDFEVIVGNKGKEFFSSVRYPEWGMASAWVLDEIRDGRWPLKDGIYYTPEGQEPRQCMTKADYLEFSQVNAYWRDKYIGAVADAWQPECLKELEKLNVSTYMPGGMGMYSLSPGHLIAGYEKIINTGYAKLRQQAQQWLDGHYENIMGADAEKYLFYTGVVITCDAAAIQIQRYARACYDKALNEADEKRRAELMKMGDGLMWISENPARTFWEAVQAVMMYHVFFTMETLIPGPAFGRFDQYTWPFLKKDLEEGRLTMDEAQEIVDAFFLKANCFYEAGPPMTTIITGIGNTYQHTTIGGVSPSDGQDATNPVTYMVLETMARLKLHDPTISLRVNKNTPTKLWECAFETSKQAGGIPLFQNDDVIVPALQKELGFELKDARNYGIIGCQEIVGSGNDWPCPNAMNPPHCSPLWGSMLLMALNNGVNPMGGGVSSVRTGYLYEMESMEEVHEALRLMVTHITKMMVSLGNYAEFVSSTRAPQVALSLSMEGCMENGKDCTAGGCKYNSFGNTATGLATIADSLTTIKYMCFDKKLCTTQELYDAVMANWEGHELLRQTILNQVPHYGNADAYADQELSWVCDLYYDICGQCSARYAKVHKAGLYGASDHIAQGYRTWATPDGRKTGEALADAMSPAQGRDRNGPTAVYTSTCCFDHSHYMDGIALNLRVHPTALSREDGLLKLRDLTRTYFDQGGMEVQYNIVDTKTLRAAQEHPEQYRDLVVRIAGYSAYFVELSRDQQNDIIARNENSL